MNDTLVLTSINGCLLSNKLVDSWLDANEMYITRKILSVDRRSVEITFVDDESMLKLKHGSYSIQPIFISKERR